MATGMNAEMQVRLLQVELAKVKAEATALRKRLRENGRHSRRVEKALEDARLLVLVKLAGVYPSRRLAAFLGMPQGRYEHALGLLRLARIVTRQRHWEVTDLPTIERRLISAKEKALREAGLFFLRHSRHRRLWSNVTK